MQKISRLPNSYTEVDYIESTGTQYIDTGYQTSNNIRVEVTAIPTYAKYSYGNPYSGFLFGARYSNTNSCFYYSNGAVEDFIGNGTTYIAIPRNTNRDTLTMIYDNNSVNYTCGNFSYSNDNLNVVITSPLNILIFNRYIPGGISVADSGTYKLYTFKIYDNDTLVRNFVPCYRNNDNEVGLYDLVNDVFYTNAGTGSFSYGEEVDYTSIIRQKLYEGGITKVPIITIGNTTIPIRDTVSKLKCDDNIIDKKSKTMYLGSFISKELDIDFRVSQNIDLTEQVTYSMKLIEDSTSYEFIVLVGVFNIETSPTDYYKKASIICLDDSVKLKSNFQDMKYYLEQWEENPNRDTKQISAINLWKALGHFYNIELGEIPSDLPNANVLTGYLDNTLSGKQYASWCAEIMGCNAKFDRTGKMILAPLTNTPSATINPLKAKSLTIGEKYKIGRIYWENGITISQSNASTEYNNLAIRMDNIFMGGTDAERQTIIDNLFAKVGNMEFYTLTTENYIDITLDSYDIVDYQVNGVSHLTFYNNSYDFKGSLFGKVDTQIPTKQVEQTTNINDGNLEQQVKTIKTIINQQDAELKIVATDIKTINDAGYQTASQVQQIINANEAKFVVQEQLINGDVKKVNANNYVMDTNGLSIARTDENDNYIEDTRSLLNGTGLSLIENATDDTILYAGYDNDTKSSIVITQNTTIKKYLNFNDGTTNVSRFETYLYNDGTNSIYDNTKRVGFFWLDE